MQVHLERSGSQYGPYSVDEINTYLGSGQVLASDMAWYDGAPGWMPLTEVPGVKAGSPESTAPPPTPGPPPTPDGPPPAPSAPPPPPGGPPPTPGADEEKKEAASGLSKEAIAMAAKLNELPEDLNDRQIDLEGDTCLYNGWIFFRKKPVAIILGAAVALPLTILSLLLVIPAGPMLGGVFYYYLQRKRLRRGGLSQMFWGFSKNFLSLLMAFMVPFVLVVVSVIPGLLLIWGSVYKFDTYVIGSEFGGLMDGIGMVLWAFIDAMTGATNLGDAWVRLQEAIWTATSQLTGFFATVGIIPGWGRMGLMVGAIMCVVMPYQLALQWMFTLPMAAQYKMGYKQAMKLSAQQVSKDKTGVLFFFIMSVMFNSLGLVIILIGRVFTKGGTGAMIGGIFIIVLGIAMLIFTFAITGTAFVVAYEEFCGRPRTMENIPNWILQICIAIGVSMTLATAYIMFTAMMSAYS